MELTKRCSLGASSWSTALKNSNGSNSNKEKIQGHTVNFFPIRRPQRLAGRVHNILTAIFTLKLKSMTCWNDCSVQEGYSKQTLMTLINGVNEVLTGRVSFCRQCSTGIMANVSGDNYIYYTLSYGILAGLWGARQLERRVKALALFKTEMCTRVFVCTTTYVFTPHPHPVHSSGKTTAPNCGGTRWLHKKGIRLQISSIDKILKVGSIVLKWFNTTKRKLVFVSRTRCQHWVWLGVYVCGYLVLCKAQTQIMTMRSTLEAVSVLTKELYWQILQYENKYIFNTIIFN